MYKSLYLYQFYGVTVLIDEYDFTGLKCPLPVLKAKRVLKTLDKGKAVVFISDDPASCLLYTSPSPRDGLLSRMPSSA